MQGDTRPPQFDDALDWHGAAEWLRWQVADVDVPGLRLDAPLEVRQPQAHATGSATEAQRHSGTTRSATEVQRHSGTTGSATDPQHDVVVRFGGADLAVSVALDADADTTRALARTADWHTALHPHYPLTPRGFALCTDTSVLGRAFFFAEHRRGVAVDTREPMALHAQSGRRQALGVALVEALARGGARLGACRCWRPALRPGHTARELGGCGRRRTTGNGPRHRGARLSVARRPTGHYARRTGRSLDGLAFHEVLALFRRAVALAADAASPRQRAAAARLAAEAKARTAG